MKKLAKILLLLPLFLFGLSAEAQACVCAMSFTDYQPCSAFWKASDVFVGTVTEIGPMNPVVGSGGKSFTTNGRFTRFKIEKAFRGVQGETIETFEHGTSCDYHFKLGESYLVYGSRDPKDGKIYVWSCSATKTLDRAESDLEYARGVLRGDPTPSIIGLVTRETRNQASEYRNNLYLEGIRVIADGGPKNVAEVFTDAKGIFRFFGLAPGSYRVRAGTPADLRRLYGEETLTLQVREGRCSGGQFTVTSLSTISGRVVDAKGLPLKTRLDLVPIDSDGKEIAPAEQSIQTYSDDQGRYKFDWLAPGRYLVTINSRNQPGSYDPPYQRTYYPGVTERVRASVIELIDGQQLSIDDFAIGPPLQTRTIEGIVLMPDGTPAANALMTLEFTERNWAETASADAQGRFSLKVYDGFKYIVAAEVRKEIQGVWRGTHSAGVEVTVGAVNQPITLTISRPGFYRPRYAQPR